MPTDRPAHHPELAPSREVMLSQIYEQYRRPIHAYTYRLLGSQEDADDVTQEVFIRAFNAWDNLYERENLSAWLYRIATNICVDMLRRRKRFSWKSLTARLRKDSAQDETRVYELADLLADSGGIPEVAERELIRLTLASIGEDHAVVLILHAAQGVPYQEIAQILGISANAAATRISRAKRIFARAYEQMSKEGTGVGGKKR